MVDDELITGGYKHDIVHLLDDDMIDEPISDNREINKAVEALMKKHKDKDAATRLLYKFQVSMLVSTDKDNANVLHVACLNGSSIIEFIISQAVKLGIKDLLINRRDV